MLELRKRADKTGKEPPDGEAWPLKHVELVGKAPTRHNFADTFVARALEDGYLSFKNARATSTTGYDRDPVVTGDEIVLSLKGNKLRYKVLEHPGRYSDNDEPSGFRVTHEYRCRLVKGR